MGKKMGNYRFVSIFISLTIIMIGFQNCGRNAEFSELAGKLINDGGSLPNSDQSDEENNEDFIDNTPAAILCNDFLDHKHAPIAQANGSYSNIDSNLILTASDNIDVINNIDGNVKIYAETPITINSIQNVDGNVILCGAMALDIRSIDGNLKVYSANLGDVDGVDGNVEITQGQFLGAMNNIDGNVRVRTD